MEPATLTLALLAASTAVSAAGAISQGNAAAASSKANARIADANAKIASQQGTERANRVRANSRRILAEQRASLAESGLIANSGTNLDLVRDSAASAELDALTTKYEANLQAAGYTQQSQLLRSDAKSQLTSGYMSSAGALLSGAAEAGMYKTRSTVQPTTITER